LLHNGHKQTELGIELDRRTDIDERPFGNDPLAAPQVAVADAPGSAGGKQRRRRHPIGAAVPAL